jgi:hypothetical protein
MHIVGIGVGAGGRGVGPGVGRTTGGGVGIDGSGPGVGTAGTLGRIPELELGRGVAWIDGDGREDGSGIAEASGVLLDPPGSLDGSGEAEAAMLGVGVACGSSGRT